MACECEAGRQVVGLVTALAWNEDQLYADLVGELSPEERTHAVHHLTGFVVGLLRCWGDPRLLIADLGAKLQAQETPQP